MQTELMTTLSPNNRGLISVWPAVLMEMKTPHWHEQHICLCVCVCLYCLPQTSLIIIIRRIKLLFYECCFVSVLVRSNWQIYILNPVFPPGCNSVNYLGKVNEQPQILRIAFWWSWHTFHNYLSVWTYTSAFSSFCFCVAIFIYLYLSSNCFHLSTFLVLFSVCVCIPVCTYTGNQRTKWIFLLQQWRHSVI